MFNCCDCFWALFEEQQKLFACISNKNTRCLIVSVLNIKSNGKVFIGTGVVATSVTTDAQSGLWQVAVVWGFAVTLAIFAGEKKNSDFWNIITM